MKRTRRIGMALIGIVSASFMLWGCYPGQSKSVNEFDTTMTYHNQSEINYGAYTKFALLDSVLTYNSEGELVNNNGQFDQQILSRVRQQMEARGYTYEADPENNGTDLKIICKVATATTYVFYQWFPGWGGGYWGGGWYYPWYPVTGVSSYSTGSLIIDMTDPAQIDPGTDAEAVVWTAVFNGLLSGSDAGMSERIDRGITQAFTQSPYLTHNP